MIHFGKSERMSSAKSGTGANAIPLGPLHPILAAKMGQKSDSGGAQGNDALSKLEIAKRVASTLFPSERNSCVMPIPTCIPL